MITTWTGPHRAMQPQWRRAPPQRQLIWTGTWMIRLTWMAEGMGPAAPAAAGIYQQPSGACPPYLEAAGRSSGEGRLLLQHQCATCHAEQLEPRKATTARCFQQQLGDCISDEASAPCSSGHLRRRELSHSASSNAQRAVLSCSALSDYQTSIPGPDAAASGPSSKWGSDGRHEHADHRDAELKDFDKVRTVYL